MTTLQPQPSRRDAVVVALFVAVVAIAAAGIELNERVYGFTRRLERWQVDELPFVLLALSIGLIWYAVRRRREVKREAAARLALEDQLKQALLDLRLVARERLSSQEEERKIIARDLHDELGQYLTALKLHASILASDLPTAEDRSRADSLISGIQRLHDVVRDLISRLRPVGLDELGLTAAIEHLVNQWQLRVPGCSISLTQNEGLDHLSEDSALTIYRVVQEGLTNAFRHAQASHIEVMVQRRATTGSDVVRVSIEDDGRGCGESGPQPGFGLRGLRERVETANGQLHLRSAVPCGLILEALLPLTSKP